MRKRLPFQITAQVVAVLTFKKLTVHTEQGSQQLTTDRKRINIILLKKTQTHASWTAFCNKLPVMAHIAFLIFYNLSAMTDVQEKPLARDRKILNDYRIIKSLTIHFYV